MPVKSIGSLTADGTEQTIGAAHKDFGSYELCLDRSNMASGDEIEVNCYLKCKSDSVEQKAMETKVFAGDQAQDVWCSDTYVVSDWIRFTLKQTAGVNRDFDYSILKA